MTEESEIFYSQKYTYICSVCEHKIQPIDWLTLSSLLLKLEKSGTQH